MIEMFCLISLVSLTTMTVTLLFVPYEYDTEAMRSENYDD